MIEKGKGILKTVLFWTAAMVVPGGTILIAYAINKKYGIGNSIKKRLSKIGSKK